MGRLTNIGKTYGTDKAEHHEFTEFYEEYFRHYSKPAILEVGILDGASLRMYDDYFDKSASIIGIDINNKGHLQTERIKILQGDIMSEKAIQQCKDANNGELYDIIIDDGGHTMEQQQITLLNLWPLLKEGGIYIVEDLHTSGIPEYNPHNTTTTLDLLGGMREGNYKRSLYLTEDQQRMIHREVGEIKIWSKMHNLPHNQQARPSITSVITKGNATIQRLKPTEDEAEELNKINQAQMTGATITNVTKKPIRVLGMDTEIGLIKQDHKTEEETVKDNLTVIKTEANASAKTSTVISEDIERNLKIKQENMIRAIDEAQKEIMDCYRRLELIKIQLKK